MQKFTLVQWILIIAIILGVFLRLYNLDDEYLFDDEQPSMIAEMKFHRQSFYDGAMYFQEHPPLGKWLLGIPSIFINADYRSLTFLGPNTFVLKYLTFESLKKNFPYIRLLNALIGILAILFTFLIIKDLFGLNAGLWSSAIMSLSADFIGLSRHDHLLKIVAVAFAIMTIYFYLKYLKSKDNYRFFYLVLTLVFFTFCIGSRNFDPLFLIPTLIFSQFLINRGKKNLIENIVFVLLLAISFYIVFYYFYPPEARAFARVHLEVDSPFDVLPGLGFIGVVKNMFLRNSYAYTIASILIIIFIVNEVVKLIKNKWNFNNLEEGSFLKAVYSGDMKAVVVLFFLVTFIGLSIMNLRFGGSSTYNVMLYGSTFLISGAVIEKLSNRKMLIYILLIGMMITTVQFMIDFPYGVWRYSNFGIGEV
ncbi:MAG: glycosyltransferase family 39 protein, partial [Nanoarchaeota archaeon]